MTNLVVSWRLSNGQLVGVWSEAETPSALPSVAVATAPVPPCEPSPRKLRFGRAVQTVLGFCSAFLAVRLACDLDAFILPFVRR